MKNPAHPGKVLKMMYIEPLELSIKATAEALDMPRVALSEIVNEKALRLRLNWLKGLILGRNFG